MLRYFIHDKAVLSLDGIKYISRGEFSGIHSNGNYVEVKYKTASLTVRFLYPKDADEFFNGLAEEIKKRNK